MPILYWIFATVVAACCGLDAATGYRYKVAEGFIAVGGYEFIILLLGGFLLSLGLGRGNHSLGKNSLLSLAPGWLAGIVCFPAAVILCLFALMLMGGMILFPLLVICGIGKLIVSHWFISLSLAGLVFLTARAKRALFHQQEES